MLFDTSCRLCSEAPLFPINEQTPLYQCFLEAELLWVHLWPASNKKILIDWSHSIVTGIVFVVNWRMAICNSNLNFLFLPFLQLLLSSWIISCKFSNFWNTINTSLLWLFLNYVFLIISHEIHHIHLTNLYFNHQLDVQFRLFVIIFVTNQLKMYAENANTYT